MSNETHTNNSADMSMSEDSGDLCDCPKKMALNSSTILNKSSDKSMKCKYCQKKVKVKVYNPGKENIPPADYYMSTQGD